HAVVAHPPCPPRDLPPFPTRRSSDLASVGAGTARIHDGPTHVPAGSRRYPPAFGGVDAHARHGHHHQSWKAILQTPADTFASRQDRKSTRLNSSHVKISYAVFCLKKK